EAKASLQRYDFDAMIIDIAMPEGSGFDLVSMVEDSSRSTLPIVVYTAMDQTLSYEPKTYARLTKSKSDLATLVETVESA
ncbi:response regulator, partial [Escherichia coli]|uniref:response regulator n=1 Tax=Escherichia coli TaxID=562 RepID=UPI0021154014